MIRFRLKVQCGSTDAAHRQRRLLRAVPSGAEAGGWSVSANYDDTSKEYLARYRQIRDELVSQLSGLLDQNAVVNVQSQWVRLTIPARGARMCCRSDSGLVTPSQIEIKRATVKVALFWSGERLLVARLPRIDGIPCQPRYRSLRTPPRRPGLGSLRHSRQRAADRPRSLSSPVRIRRTPPVLRPMTLTSDTSGTYQGTAVGDQHDLVGIFDLDRIDHLAVALSPP